jgi:hypothetical protein
MTPAIALPVPPLGSPVVKPTLISRLAGAASEPFRVWFPPQSPLRIEYSRELLRLLLPRQDGEYSSGVLYGARTAGGVRVISARPLADLEPVGVFAARWCGEVFLTEPDILRLENMDEELESGGATGGIALVIAGGFGGFFVREPNGSMQTVQSYQEFPIRAPSLQPTRTAALIGAITQAARLKFAKPGKLLNHLKFANNPKLVKHVQQLVKHVQQLVKHVQQLVKQVQQVNEWLPLALVAAAVVILTGCVFPPPYFSRPSSFTVQERDGQLRIALTPGAVSPGARLQIVDGEERRSIAISPTLTSVLYAPRTHDVHITLVR